MIYGSWLVLNNFLPKERIKVWFFISCIIIFIISTSSLYLVVFGNGTTELLSIYKKQELNSSEIDISFKDKVENIKFAEDSIVLFIEDLYIEPISIILFMSITLLLIISIINKKINVKNTQNILHEYN